MVSVRHNFRSRAENWRRNSDGSIEAVALRIQTSCPVMYYADLFQQAEPEFQCLRSARTAVAAWVHWQSHTMPASFRPVQ